MNFFGFFEVMIFQNSVKAYILSLSGLFCLMFILYFIKKNIVYRLERLAKKTKGELDDLLIKLISQIGWVVIFVISLYIASSPLNLNESIRSILKYALIISVTLRAIFMLQEVALCGVKNLYNKKLKPEDPSKPAMISSTTALLKWIIWSLGLIFVLDNLGIDISAFVAGIGIGGIAVAVAAQAILGDAFSAVSIFLDKPFELGDFIIIDDMLGTVEHIGIKTTRVRSLSGEQLIFSNSDLTKSRIKNYKRMQTRRIVFKIRVVYQTPIEKAKRIPEIIKGIFDSMDLVRLDRAHFQSFGDFSLIYEIVYYVLSSDYNIYMDKQQQINFRIMEAFEAEQIEFAYPTQTLFFNKVEAK